MVDASVDVDLEWDLEVNQDLLGVVAVLLGEDAVDFCLGCCGQFGCSLESDWLVVGEGV